MTPESDPQQLPIPELQRLIGCRENLWKAFNAAFKRTAEPKHAVDNIVFFYGRRCVEDFKEILLLCQHGYASGANALLRGMYERAVTAMYLAKHPDEADDFLDFHWISQRRLMNQIRETFGPDALKEEVVEDAKANFQRVEQKFQITKCRKCGATGQNHTWTKLDFVSMAKTVGDIGRKLIVSGYALPTQDVHATVKAMLDRLTTDEEDVVQFNPEPDVDKITRVLATAHAVILAMLELQQNHFELDGLKAPLEECVRDFEAVWKTNDAPGAGS